VLILIRKFASLIMAISVCSALFLAWPLYQFFKNNVELKPEKKLLALNMAAQKLPPKKPKTLEQPKESQKQKPTDAPKEIARQRFAMDLGVGGGEGGASIGGSNAPASYDEGETDVSPVLQRMVPPEYPEKALKAGVSGNGKIRIVIMPSGDVSSEVEFIQLPGSGLGFEESIRKAVSQWKFKPAQIDGVPVAVKMEFPLQF
jgi:periplasmic protein TonB